MSYLTTSSSNPSAEFVALCESQMVLLTKALHADWSIVYLTTRLNTGEETELVPIVVYPPTEAIWQQKGRLPILPEVRHKIDSTSDSMAVALPEVVDSPHASFNRGDTVIPWGNKTDEEKQQLVIPLIYEDIVMGLLVTRRKEGEWEATELNQIDRIANTIAIACMLDRQKSWYEEQLHQQERIQQIERDHLDDLLHQLRNPLTALRTFAKLVLKRLMPDDQNRTAMQGILRESERLQSLLQEFEAGSTPEVATVTLNTTSLTLSEEVPRDRQTFFLPPQTLPLESIAIKAILDPLIISASAIAQEKTINLTSHIPDGLPPIQGNIRALQEVFSNLIDNALKYTPQGGAIKIVVQPDIKPSAENWLRIEIRDSGYGIPPQDRDRLFERHYRGIQANSDIPGTGLGLAIAKELIEQMHGKIELISPNHESKTNTLPGTTCILRLPLAQEISQK